MLKEDAGDENSSWLKLYSTQKTEENAEKKNGTHTKNEVKASVHVFDNGKHGSHVTYETLVTNDTHSKWL